MKPDIVVFGAGGHTRSLIPLIRSNGYTISAIYDDSYKNEVDEQIDGIPVIGKIGDYTGKSKIVLSYGNGGKRNELTQIFEDYLLKENLIHSSCIIEKSVEMNVENQIFPGVIINAQVSIGKNNIINTRAVLEHEACIGDFNHISVGSIVAGRVKIGNYCFIGAGAVIIDKLTITNNVIIGANAVVVKDIHEPGTYAGNPAKKLK